MSEESTVEGSPRRMMLPRAFVGGIAAVTSTAAVLEGHFWVISVGWGMLLVAGWARPADL